MHYKARQVFIALALLFGVAMGVTAAPDVASATTVATSAPAGKMDPYCIQLGEKTYWNVRPTETQFHWVGGQLDPVLVYLENGTILKEIWAKSPEGKTVFRFTGVYRAGVNYAVNSPISACYK